MPLLKIRNLGSVGLVRDIISHEYPENAFSDVLNVRFTARGVVRVPTPVKVLNAPAGAMAFSSCVRSTVGAEAFCAAPTELFIGDHAGGFVSAGSGYASATDWHPEVYGRTMLYNSFSNTPQACEDGQSTFATITGWPVDLRCRTIRAYKNFLVALHLLEGGVDKPNVILWSDAAYNNGLPPNWDYNDPGSFSGEATVGVSDGQIVDARVMGDSLIIYCETGAHSMQFVGGGFVMQFRELFRYGLMCRDAVGVIGRQHLVVGRDRIYLHDGVNVSFPAEDRVERAIFRDISDPENVRVVINPVHNEAHISFMSNEDGQFCSWVWNWSDNTWTRHLHPGVTYQWAGPLPTEIYRWSDADADGSLWSDTLSQSTRWSEYSGAVETALLELAPGQISISYGNYSADDRMAYFESRIVRTGIDLDSIDEMDSGVIKFIRRIYPIMTGDDAARVRFRFGATMSPDKPVTWTDWQYFSVHNGVKVDTRVTGRYLAFEMVGERSDPGGWALTGLDVDVTPAGGR